MGVFSIEISIGDIERRQWRELSAVVDVSSPVSFAPGSMLRELGISPAMRPVLRLPDGSVRTMDLGYAWLWLNGREAMTHFVFGDESTPPLLGRIALNSLFLELDPLNERLVPMTNLTL